MGRLKGDPAAPGGGAKGQQYNHFLAAEGVASLRGDVDRYVEQGHLNFTRPSRPLINLTLGPWPLTLTFTQALSNHEGYRPRRLLLASAV